jgi:hypothetical protein
MKAIYRILLQTVQVILIGSVFIALVWLFPRLLPGFSPAQQPVQSTLQATIPATLDTTQIVLAQQTRDAVQTVQAQQTQSAQLTLTPGAPPYPPPGSLPATTRIITPTPWPISALPPIPGYPPPPPPPIHELRLVFGSTDPTPGLYSIRTDGTGLMYLPDLKTLDQISQYTGKVLQYYNATIFNSEEVGDQIAIWTMNPDGSERRLLVQATADWYPSSPIWSPDGSQIAYIRNFLAGSYRDGPPVDHQELWVMNSDGSNHYLVTSERIFFLQGSEGRKLFIKWFRNGYIYFVNFGRSLYAVNPINGMLYWIQDGVNPVGEVRSLLGPSGVHILGGSNVSPLQAMGFSSVSGQSWSWDGNKLVDTLGQELWITDLTSAQRYKAATIPNGAQLTPLSPDYKFIAYLTDDGLFTLDLQQPNAQPLLVATNPHHLSGNFLFIDWLPIR